jgi:hypothetical protein
LEAVVFRISPVIIAGAVALMLGWAEPAAAQSDAIDSRITFILGDDNVFAGAADFSPTADIGPRRKINTFFDNRQTKDNGQESKTDFSLYRKFGGPYPRLETEAALVVRLDLTVDPQTGKPGTSFYDDGSFLQASYFLGDMPELKEGELAPKHVAGRTPRFYALAFPFNADRIRLGYSYDLTWGGNPIFPKNTTGAPGLKLGWDGEQGYAWVAMKSHRQLNEMTNNLEAVYAVLAAAGWDLTPELRWEANGGYFQRGVFPAANNVQTSAVDGSSLYASGVSSQLTYHQGVPITTSIDLRLYRNDPDFAFKAFRPEVYSDGLSYKASVSGTFLVQNLRKAENPSSTDLQNAKAADLVLLGKYGWHKLSADFVYQDIAFILFNVPGYSPYYDFAKSATTTPEWFVDLGYDYYFESLRLNPGFIVGYEHPATYLGDSSSLGGLDNIGTVVVRRQGDFDILPPGQGAYDIISLRAFTRWDMSDGMSLAGEVTYTLDKNATRLVRAPDGTVMREFDKDSVTNRLAVALILQGRF